MQTSFTPAQLADAETREADRILRSCVHCGFCTATCPTYVLLGDELDGPRGRIYLIKDMLESGRAPTAPVVKHIDRCLSCLACMTTCPSGVNYMHLVDQARHRIEENFRRPLADRLLRRFLALLLPRPWLFRLALLSGAPVRPWARRLPGRLGAIGRLLPRRIPPPSPVDRPQVFPAEGPRRLRVALLSGCVQTVLAPQINEAAVRLLTRHGCEVVVAQGAGCCGSILHHLGHNSLAYARANIDAWLGAAGEGGLDAVAITTSGCGVTVRDWGHMLRQDRAYAAKAARVSALARDICEIMAELGLKPPTRATGQRVAYHAACSLQHGQQVLRQPRALLAAAGFTLLEIPEGHLCCGSAGTYNMLEPQIAAELRARKAEAIASTRPEIVAAGNIGCITQIAGAVAVPVVHTVELLDWATGGPSPPGLGAASASRPGEARQQH